MQNGRNQGQETLLCMMSTFTTVACRTYSSRASDHKNIAKMPFAQVRLAPIPCFIYLLIYRDDKSTTKFNLITDILAVDATAHFVLGACRTGIVLTLLLRRE